MGGYSTYTFSEGCSTSGIFQYCSWTFKFKIKQRVLLLFWFLASSLFQQDLVDLACSIQLGQLLWLEVDVAERKTCRVLRLAMKPWQNI